MKTNLIPWRRKRKTNDWPATARENPLAELYQRMNDLFTEFFEDGAGLVRWDPAESGASMIAMPTFDVAETDKDIDVRVELPGLDEKDIEITLDENILTIRGEKKQERTEKKKNYYLSECRYGQFHRAVPLPAGIDRDKAKAAFKKGVLRITLPKTEAAQTDRRQIAIETA